MKLKLRGCLAAVLCSVVFAFAFAQSQSGDSKPLLPPETSAAAVAVAAPAPAPAAKTDPHVKPGTDYPHEELALLYSYFHLSPSDNTPKANFNGASASFAYNFNRYLGVVGDLGGYYLGKYVNSGSSSKLASYLFGPRVSFRTESRVTPFVQILVGGAHGASGVLGGSSLNGFALATGGGLDWTLSQNHRWALRLPQVEYVMTRLNPGVVGLPPHQNDTRLSGGLVYRFGYKPVAINQPPTAACQVTPGAVTLGAATAVALNVNGSDADGDALTYAYNASGGTITGTGATARWDLANANPGSYNATAQVNDGHGGTSSCTAAVTVNARPLPPANRPPTVSLSSDRDTVLVGECVRFTANGADPDGDRLTYSWSANGGQVTPTNNTAQLCTVGLAPGNYTMTVRVEDGRGGAADASKAITVNAPPPPPMSSKLSECAFKPAVSSRVDNVCKRILDDVATRLQNDARARVVIVGYADPKARRPDQLATARGTNAVKYLQTKGIDANRVMVRTGSGQVGGGAANQRIELIWVPEGATY